MDISILGSGNMAYFMALRLYAAGHRIVAVCSRNIQEAKRLANLTGATSCERPEAFSGNAAVYIFALPDAVLKDAVRTFPYRDKIVIYCAGALSLTEFSVPEIGVLWPLYSINKEHLPIEKNIPLFWEAKGVKAQKILPELAKDLSENVCFANFETRQELHLSAVFVNNFVNHLMAITQMRMQDLGLPFKESLQPIIEETIWIALSGKSVQHQTGAAIRNDKLTMDKHLALLSKHPEWQEVYQSISASIQQLYHHLNLNTNERTGSV